MKRVALVILAAAVFVPAAAALPRSYPSRPEGSILTGLGDRTVQLIIMKQTVDQPETELRGVLTGAVVRDVMIVQLHLASRGGHTPRRGNVLVWLLDRHVNSTRLFLAAWAPRSHVFNALKMLNQRNFPGWRTLWVGQFGE